MPFGIGKRIKKVARGAKRVARRTVSRGTRPARRSVRRLATGAFRRSGAGRQVRRVGRGVRRLRQRVNVGRVIKKRVQKAQRGKTRARPRRR